MLYPSSGDCRILAGSGAYIVDPEVKAGTVKVGTVDAVLDPGLEE